MPWVSVRRKKRAHYCLLMSPAAPPCPQALRQRAAQRCFLPSPAASATQPHQRQCCWPVAAQPLAAQSAPQQAAGQRGFLGRPPMGQKPRSQGNLRGLPETSKLAGWESPSQSEQMAASPAAGGAAAGRATSGGRGSCSLQPSALGIRVRAAGAVEAADRGTTKKEKRRRRLRRPRWH